mmetsp:Transcript_8915/g.15340  ORF Transcript_8915/g.15340 Transcript_8915/m.15340 type:complete len:232 (-) Transcript_8915:240-935(-)
MRHLLVSFRSSLRSSGEEHQAPHHYPHPHQKHRLRLLLLALLRSSLQHWRHFLTVHWAPWVLMMKCALWHQEAVSQEATVSPFVQTSLWASMRQTSSHSHRGNRHQLLCRRLPVHYHFTTTQRQSPGVDIQSALHFRSHHRGVHRLHSACSWGAPRSSAQARQFSPGASSAQPHQFSPGASQGVSFDLGSTSDEAILSAMRSLLVGDVFNLQFWIFGGIPYVRLYLLNSLL